MMRTTGQIVRLIGLAIEVAGILAQRFGPNRSIWSPAFRAFPSPLRMDRRGCRLCALDDRHHADLLAAEPCHKAVERNEARRFEPLIRIRLEFHEAFPS